MKILYVALKHDYGEVERGLSFEHHNFYESLHFMGHDILYFDFMGLLEKRSRDWMNRRLLEVVKSEEPDLMFSVLFKDEIDKNVIEKVSRDTGTTTVNWFCDDHWRFEDFSRFFAPSFNWVVTTAQSSVHKYEQIGYSNAIKSQWACNHNSYRQLDLAPKYDVTFIGQPHGNRRPLIEMLKRAGIDVRVWGRGWDSGRLSQEEMIEIFNQSRINLNLSNSSVSSQKTTPQKKIRRISRALDRFPLGRPLKRGLKKMRSAATQTPETLELDAIAYHDQIKGRSFEVPGCAGFMLSGMADDLENYYELDKEVVCFTDARELIDQVRYYLNAEDERLAIARAGYERTLNEHTYAHRFADIFTRTGLEVDSVFDNIDGQTGAGQTEEIS